MTIFSIFPSSSQVPIFSARIRGAPDGRRSTTRRGILVGGGVGLVGGTSRRGRFLGAMDFPCPALSASTSPCRRSKSKVGFGSRISRISGGSFQAAMLLSLSLAAVPLPAGTHVAQRGAMCLRGGSGGGGGGGGGGGAGSVGVGGGGGRGGEGGDQVRTGISSTAKQHSDDPVCFRLSSSSALQREWESAKASPTAQVTKTLKILKIPQA